MLESHWNIERKHDCIHSYLQLCIDCNLFTDWPTEAKDPPVDAAGPLLKQEEEQSHRATGMTSNSYSDG